MKLATALLAVATLVVAAKALSLPVDKSPDHQVKRAAEEPAAVVAPPPAPAAANSTSAPVEAASTSAQPAKTEVKSTKPSNVTVNVFLQLAPDAKTEELINNPDGSMQPSNSTTTTTTTTTPASPAQIASTPAQRPPVEATAAAASSASASTPKRRRSAELVNFKSFIFPASYVAHGPWEVEFKTAIEAAKVTLAEEREKVAEFKRQKEAEHVAEDEEDKRDEAKAPINASELKEYDLYKTLKRRNDNADVDDHEERIRVMDHALHGAQFLLDELVQHAKGVAPADMGGMAKHAERAISDKYGSFIRHMEYMQRNHRAAKEVRETEERRAKADLARAEEAEREARLARQ